MNSRYRDESFKSESLSLTFINTTSAEFLIYGREKTFCNTSINFC